MIVGGHDLSPLGPSIKWRDLWVDSPDFRCLRAAGCGASIEPKRTACVSPPVNPGDKLDSGIEYAV